MMRYLMICYVGLRYVALRTLCYVIHFQSFQISHVVVKSRPRSSGAKAVVVDRANCSMSILGAINIVVKVALKVLKHLACDYVSAAEQPVAMTTNESSSPTTTADYFD